MINHSNYRFLIKRRVHAKLNVSAWKHCLLTAFYLNGGEREGTKITRELIMPLVDCHRCARLIIDLTIAQTSATEQRNAATRHQSHKSSNFQIGERKRENRRHGNKARKRAKESVTCGQVNISSLIPSGMKQDKFCEINDALTLFSLHLFSAFK